MWSNESVTVGDGVPTEEKLCRATALFVSMLLLGGSDARSIRRRVLDIAGPVIQALAEDEYRVESHFAIVQRTVDAVLARSGAVANVQNALRAPSRDAGHKCIDAANQRLLDSLLGAPGVRGRSRRDSERTRGRLRSLLVDPLVNPQPI